MPRSGFKPGATVRDTKGNLYTVLADEVALGGYVNLRPHDTTQGCMLALPLSKANAELTVVTDGSTGTGSTGAR